MRPVSSAGGRYRYQDDQETPDTHLVTFNFADRKAITWEGLSCNRMPADKTADVLALHGLVPWAVVLSGSHQVTGTSTGSSSKICANVFPCGS